MSKPKIGWAEGKCNNCGKTLRRRRPADIAVCDCFLFCPLCGAEMTPYTPDLDPKTYRAEKTWDVTGAASQAEATADTLYYCPNHTPLYYSSLKPVEVVLR